MYFPMKAFGTNLQKLQNKRKFSDPDKLANAKEELQKYVKHYQQISGFHAIAQQIYLTNNRSHSFRVFINGILKLLSTTD